MPDAKLNTCFEKETLAEYLGERLTEVEEANIRKHLDDCSDCQQQLEQVAANQTMWASLRQHVSISRESATEDEIDQRRQTLIDFLAPTDDPRMLGRLGGYEICGFIGQGSTGIVLKAYEPSLNRYVAIKVLSPAFSSNGAARKRFEREGRAVAAVVHQNIVPIHAVDQFRHLPYIVMQYVPGVSLLQRLEKSGPLDTCEVARIGLQVAKGLAAAHKVGIIHRDVKPANVILENTIERAMVTDFGLARVADDASMTCSGTIAGTPQYMSPEQARGEMIDARSDLFSLGSLMYSACTARPPFRAETIVGVIHRVCNAEPLPIREVNPGIAPWMCEFVARLLSKDPESRFQTASEVSKLLSDELAYLQNPTQSAEPERDWQLVVHPTIEEGVEQSISDSNSQTKPRPVSESRLRVRFFAIAAVLVAVAAVILIPGAGESFTRLLGSLNRSSPAVVPFVEGPSKDNAKVVETITKNGAEITWTKYENDWSTNASVTFDQKWEKSFAVDGQGTLRLDVDEANLLVRAADADDAVTVTMMRRVEASSLGKAKSVFEDYSPRLSVVDDGFELTCEANAKERPQSIQQVVYRVAIPAKFNVDVQLESGDITIGELEGNVTTSTGFGAIQVGRTKGDLKVVGRGGCIDLTAGCDGGADVECVNADVYAANLDQSSRLRLSGGSAWIGKCEGEVYAQTSGGNIKVENTLGKVSGFALDGDVEVRLDETPTEDCRFGATGGKLSLFVGTDVAATFRTTVSEMEGFEVVESDRPEDSIHERRLNGGGAIVSTKVDSGELSFAIVDSDATESLNAKSLGGSGAPTGLGGSGGLSPSTRSNFLTARAKFSDVPAAGKITNIAIENGGEMDGYSLYLPVSFDPNESDYPILVSLGGAWSVGNSIDAVNNWGMSRLVRDESNLKNERNRLLLDSFLIVAPHIQNGQYSSHPETVQNIIDSVAERFRGDKDRVYLTGLSRGGHGTWGLVSQLPDVFAAIVPVCGDAEDLKQYSAFENTSVWIACNTGDGYYEVNQGAVERIEEATNEEFLVINDPDVSGTDYLNKRFVFTAPRRNHHDAWTELYTRSELYKWMLKQSKTN